MPGKRKKSPTPPAKTPPPAPSSSSSEEPQHPSATSPALSLTPQEQQFLQAFLRQHQANHGTAMPAAPAPLVVGGGGGGLAVAKDASWQPTWHPSLPALPRRLGDAPPPRGRAEHASLPSLRPDRHLAGDLGKGPRCVRPRVEKGNF